MSNIKLLIIDDDMDVLDSFKQSNERYSRTEGNGKFEIYEASTLEEAFKKIDSYKIDTAIVDLRLDQQGSDAEDGNQAIARLIESFRLPIFVLTGSPQDLQESYKENPMIRLIKRGDKTDLEILTEIDEEHKSNYIQFFKQGGFLEQKLNNLYWKHFKDTSKDWMEIAKNFAGDFERVISRHTVACLNEQLYTHETQETLDKYHPGEFYIMPPIKPYYHTGDIISNDEGRYVVLSPACDIENKASAGKLDFYILAEINDPLDMEKVKNKSTPEKQEEYIRNSLETNNTDRFHFIPQFSTVKRGVIDFQNIKTIKVKPEEGSEDCIEKYRRLATVAPSFLKDVIARFASYYARQGQPVLLRE